ncbi:MAG: hypothetical protein HKP61_00725 [Dactylosporangium sp.]|nr:hypothetical protein [Dactylosporangium sp.]NNJ59493.1 hypothetical protein [Dactylosporangium sp.]
MVDIDDLLRGALHEQADRAPAGERLLATVHTRSRTLRRRRMTMAGGIAVAILSVGMSAVLVAAGRDEPAAPPAIELPSPSSVPSASPVPSEPVDPTAAVSPSPQDAATAAATSLRFAPSAYAMPDMPFLFPSPVAADYQTPVVTLQRDALVAYYATRDPRDGADVTLVVTRHRPTFRQPAGAVSETTHRVRWKSGTLRTAWVSPAAQLTLYWQESSTRWVQLKTDDTFTDDDLVDFGNALVKADLPIAVPMRLDQAPAGMTLETATPSMLAFRPEHASRAGSLSATSLSCTVVEYRPLAGTTVMVGKNRGILTRDHHGALLTVNLSSWHLTLLVEVPAQYAVGDADLIRFAAGVHLTEQAETRESSADDVGDPFA